ncbi:hypothetical protein HNR65_001813 [Desulfosalsimonas propionicica]|uniref:Uncharacterized protein n=1 Tax=Desulfosalsimonas propionicica TaxID=332175 RepID=A0A7W0C971_9BACT|nr:hypothetical protein [Desulfosalsimonas propionicica]MBA2881486.1 hypothetical protein [Desulfosalsimonas propionicica]
MAQAKSRLLQKQNPAINALQNDIASTIGGMQQFPVLAGNADVGCQVRMVLHDQYQGRHFDGFGPGAEYKRYFFQVGRWKRFNAVRLSWWWWWWWMRWHLSVLLRAAGEPIGLAAGRFLSIHQPH